MLPYRVLVVDDSAFMRKIITDMISGDPRFSVVATARNGKEAIVRLREERPDVITMDVEMPEMNGIEALAAIMQEAPTPVIMLSSLTDEGAAQTIKALESGAFDFIHKPSGSISLDLHRVREELLEKLFAAAVSGVKPRKTASLFMPVLRPEPPPQNSQKLDISMKRSLGRMKRGLVAIGTSTGGPKALQCVLTALPADYPFPLVIVQHMPPGFTKSLAQRLNSLCAIRVQEAEDAVSLQGGTAYIAPGGLHMKVVRESGRLVTRLSGDPPRAGHRPSVDVLFESIAPHTELDITAVIMTGMGSDGARGMKLLGEQGVQRTIAEHASTCVVYGMPRAAAEIGRAAFIVPLEQISGQLLKAASYPVEV